MKLYRPSIPTVVKLRVVLRQLGEMFIDEVVREHRFSPRDHRGRSHGKLLRSKLVELAALLGCEVKDLRLDHNPALGLRKKRRTGRTIMVGGEPVDVLVYTPAANDPEYLIYRSKHAHHIKTNVRGDGAQYSDTQLMKRDRRRKRKKMLKKLAGKPVSVFAAVVGPSRKMRPSIPKRANPWGPKGTRKIRGRSSWAKSQRSAGPTTPSTAG